MTKIEHKSCQIGSWTIKIGTPIIISYGNFVTDIVVEVIGVASERNGHKHLIGWEFGFIHSKDGIFTMVDKHLIAVYELDICSIKLPNVIAESCFEFNGKVYYA